jgi:hypothetical protein
MSLHSDALFLHHAIEFLFASMILHCCFVNLLFLISFLASHFPHHFKRASLLTHSQGLRYPEQLHVASYNTRMHSQ